MLAIGRFNTLNVIRQRDTDIYLDGGDSQEIALIPGKKPLPTIKVGDALTAFIYSDGQGVLWATLDTPYAQVDEVAFLKVVSSSHAGAFLDWGMPKDLLVPFSEQKIPMHAGRSYLVRLFLDESNRIAASMQLDDFLQDEAFYYKENQTVSIIVAEPTDLGFKVVVDNQYWGLLYKSEVFQPLSRGQKLSAFVKKLRSDHRLDLILDNKNYGEKRDSTTDDILQELTRQGGFLALTDKSSPEVIYKTFGVSKKIFKQAIGILYKQRKIVIEETGIRITNPND